MTLFVEGLAIVPVNRTTSLFASFNCANAAPISLCASAQVILFFPLEGSFKRNFSSYNDNTEA